MKTIGLISGMSHEWSVKYYKIINEEINRRKKGLHSAKMLIESYDFDEIEKLQSKENWEELTKILTESAKKLEAAGADYIAIATNTMHICADEVQKQINIPLIHIAELGGNYIKKKNFDAGLLMGTKYAVTKPFYKDKLKNEFNINVIIPDDIEQKTINNIIYDELCIGIIKESSRLEHLEIINNYKLKGAKAVVLGCTELPNIIKEADIEIINTTKIHSLEIADKILT